jgi:hypothetical protein
MEPAMRPRDVAARVGITQRAAQMSMKSRDGSSEVAISSSKMERAMSFLTTSRAPAFADQKGRFTKPLFGFAPAILVQLPDPQGHLSLRIWRGTPPTLAYTKHYTSF